MRRGRNPSWGRGRGQGGPHGGGHPSQEPVGRTSRVSPAKGGKAHLSTGRMATSRTPPAWAACQSPGRGLAPVCTGFLLSQVAHFSPLPGLPLQPPCRWPALPQRSVCLGRPARPTHALCTRGVAPSGPGSGRSSDLPPAVCPPRAQLPAPGHAGAVTQARPPLAGVLCPSSPGSSHRLFKKDHWDTACPSPWKLPVASRCIEMKIQPPGHVALYALGEQPPLGPEGLHLLNGGNDPRPHGSAVRMRAHTCQLLPPLCPALFPPPRNCIFFQVSAKTTPFLRPWSPWEPPFPAAPAAPFPLLSSCAVSASPKCRGPCPRPRCAPAGPIGAELRPDRALRVLV